jgi:hypothetical protein
MHRIPFVTWAAFVLVGLAAIGVRADDAPDLSTPKKAAMAFTKAVETGDLNGVKTTSVGSEADYQLVQSIMDFLAANQLLRQAAIDRFGQPASEQIPDLSNLSKQVEQGAEKMDGDTATVGKADDKEPMKLKKIDGQWKCDLSAIPDKQQVSKAMPKMRQIMLDVTTDIKAGKYKTVEEAKDAMSKAIFDLMAQQLNVPSATQPAKP